MPQALDVAGFALPDVFDDLGVAIYLTRGFTAVVDEIDAEWARKILWRANFSSKSTVYARCTEDYMHRMIVKPPSGFVVDHKNGCTLDNRRKNLRIATHRQNSGNFFVSRGGVEYKGVWEELRRPRLKKPFRAKIRLPSGSRRQLGYFATPEQAAKAYDRAAAEIFGEFAWLNFPEDYEKG